MIRRLAFILALLAPMPVFAFTSGNIVTYSDSTGAHVQDSGVNINQLDNLGTIATQNADNVNITGGVISGTHIIGALILGQDQIGISTGTTVVSGDNGKTFIAGGDAFYPVGFGAATTYPANFAVAIQNADSPLSGTGRAKWVNLNGAAYPTSCYLWPGQTAFVYRSANAWATSGCGQRYRLPSGVTTVHVDPSSGSDVYGVSDGLSTGTGARRSFYDALTFVDGQFDLDGGNSPPADVSSEVVVLGSGADDSQNIHFAPHSMVGAAQTAALTVDCAGGKLAGSPSAQFFYGARVKMQNCEIAPSGQNGIEVIGQAQVYLVGGMIFDAVCSTCAQMRARSGGQIQYSTDYQINGNAGYHVFLDSGGQFIPFFAVNSPINVTFNGNYAFNQAFVHAESNSYANMFQISWGSGSEVGQSYQMKTNGVVDDWQDLPASLTQGFSSTVLEGNWSPQFTGSTSGTYSPTGVGAWSANGNRLTASFAVVATSAASPVGNLSIAGLPITSTASSPNLFTCPVSYWNDNVVLDTGYTQLAAQVNPMTKTMTFFESGPAVATQALGVGRATVPFEIHGFCDYLVN